jgi:hypothetical protein
MAADTVQDVSSELSPSICQGGCCESTALAGGDARDDPVYIRL